MSKVIMTCGMICCGKSTYAKKLQAEQNAIILSIDDITLTLFPDGSGDMHDTYALRAEQYLLNLSIQVLLAGVDVILDWGLWTRAVRNRIRQFYASHEGIKTELPSTSTDSTAPLRMSSSTVLRASPSGITATLAEAMSAPSTTSALTERLSE